MSLDFDINPIAVIVATVACTLLGGLYFTVVVAKPYAAVMGRENEPAWQPPASAFAGQFVSTLLVVLTSSVLLNSLRITEIGTGLLFGLVVGVGHLAAQTLNIAINPNFPHPFRYTAINAPYFIACSVITGAIVTALA
ncbi:hypothetical protein GCM10022223_66700 [Kineosporia mesophila]|uniref:DUF1761 domain-containing protein n=1 Tax=Kineosporia mesophila TaxID=566012 RepID=A0ABP7ARG0_9ACTN|nr:DUF1761 domain-containing protein [Kineosporia mesophila]